ncbi:MAG: hypothetical protein LBU21_05270 [Treponema sp.]|jgi:hypothetical protein|nr:hypothetical protein [Treponema sp.]
MDCKKVFSRFETQDVFLKTVTRPRIDGTQKAALNRKGNALYNAGDIEGARRVFLTTGYTDGLVRIGDYYMTKGRKLDALRMYWIAPDRKKSESIIMELSSLIQNLIHEEDHANG